MIYYDQYGNLDDLGLPCSPRTYFDPICSEYSEYSAENKMLDIGYLTTHGYDIRKDIYYCFQHYDHVTEDEVHRAVQTLEAAASGVDLYKSGIRFRKNSLETDIDLMLEEIMRRYRFPRPTYERHYMAEDCYKMADWEINQLNGWKQPYIDMGNETRYSPFYIKDGTITYPGDQAILLNHNNDEHKPNKIVTALRPEPWYGEVLNAKLIILGNMPVYEDYICRSQNIALDIRIKEQIDIYVNYWLELGLGNGWGTHYLYGFEKYPWDDSIDIMDFYYSPTYHHWVKELQELSESSDIHKDRIFGNTAIINAFPYYNQTPGAKHLGLGMLPSHYFLRQLLRYITINNPDTLIVIPSKKLDGAWRTILADVYYSNRIVVCQNANTALSLSRRALGEELYDAIATRLR